jgi:hypothetical protein
MNWKRFAGKCKAGLHILRAQALPSYSQAGEDQIVRYLFGALGIEKPEYLDIGANHPFLGNNTYYFYLRGSNGVCIEPDPGFSEMFRKYRSRDILLPIGIGLHEMTEASLYIFPFPYSGWNTFSEEEALHRQQESGIGIQKVQKIALQSINEVISQYFDPYPNFLSIDAEGMDLAILQSLDFSRYKPQVICAETVSFSTQNLEDKVSDISHFLQSQGYFVFADTHINTIFCRIDAYKTKGI